ncbi:MAG: hypothetical protein [Bacteriophage sp.]|nr:MAG: hypothetical protein [Bacteriophage sp.]
MRQITAMKLADTQLYMRVLISFVKLRMSCLWECREDMAIVNKDVLANAQYVIDDWRKYSRGKEGKLIYFDSVELTIFTTKDGESEQLNPIIISSDGTVEGDVNREDLDEVDGIKVLTNAFVEEIKKNSTEVEK